jgi:hypothetical protein
MTVSPLWGTPPMPSAAQAHSAALGALSRGSEHGQAVLGASLPRAISEAGERAAFHSVEFFTARIPNPNTRAAYGHAVAELCQSASGASGGLSPSPPSPPLSWRPTFTSSNSVSARPVPTSTSAAFVNG